jgi:hypothetical protein
VPKGSSHQSPRRRLRKSDSLRQPGNGARVEPAPSQRDAMHCCDHAPRYSAHPPVLAYSISLKAIQPASSRKAREARKQPSTPSVLLSCQFLMVRGLYGRAAFWGGYVSARPSWSSKEPGADRKRSCDALLVATRRGADGPRPGTPPTRRGPDLSVHHAPTEPRPRAARVRALLEENAAQPPADGLLVSGSRTSSWHSKIDPRSVAKNFGVPLPGKCKLDDLFRNHLIVGRTQSS